MNRVTSATLFGLAPWENSNEGRGGKWKTPPSQSITQNLTNLCSMSQFVIEAHISRLWCFYSRFNRAGVSVSYPFTFLLLSAFRKTKKRKKETVTSTEEMKTAKFTRFRRRAYVCVCVSEVVSFRGKVSSGRKELSILQPLSDWIAENERMEEEHSTSSAAMRYQASNKKRRNGFRWWWIAIHSSLILIVVPASIRLLFINYARRRRGIKLFVIFSLLLRVVLAARSSSRGMLKDLSLQGQQ